MNIGAGIGVGFSNPRGELSFEYEQSQACQNGSDVTPIINNPGGTFSATPAGLSLNSTTGVIDVSASTVGTYTVTYSIGPTEDTITIQAPDDSSFSYSASSFRQNASNPAPTITGLVGGVFSGPTGIIFADSGTNTNSSSGIINLAASTVGGPYTITYTTTGNCPTSRNFDVTIQVALSITYSAASFCEDGGNTAAPTVVGDPGSGTFASTTGLTINSTTGVINTDTSTPDENTPYTVTYTASTGETATTQVTIKNLDNATFSYSATSFCENASNQTPSITTPGGTFTSQDISFRSFQMQFEVASGVSKTITIPSTVGSSFTVDWGDGATTTETGGTISHTYNDGNNTDVTNPTVSIGAIGDSGAFTYFKFNNGGSKSDLIDVPQWGSIVWSNMSAMFYGCNNSNFTTITATDTPDLNNVTSFLSAFRITTYLQSINNINNWDVSNVQNMGYMFNSSAFNSDITSWDVSSATSFSNTFNNATSFNQNLSSWDVSSATNMSGMFRSATSFNQNLSSWDLNTSSFSANLAFRSSGMSTANYTDTLVGWANYVYINSAPYTVNASLQNSMTFDRARSGGANFADAGAARDYLTGATANWTISGDTEIN